MNLESWKKFLLQHRLWIFGGVAALFVLLLLRWMILEWLRKRKVSGDTDEIHKPGRRPAP